MDPPSPIDHVVLDFFFGESQGDVAVGCSESLVAVDFDIDWLNGVC